MAKAGTDSAWSAPTLDTARLLSRWTPTRIYEFSERDTPWFNGYPTPSFDQPAQHMSGQACLFDLALFQDVKDGQAQFSDRMISTWVGFARTGRADWPGFRGAGEREERPRRQPMSLEAVRTFNGPRSVCTGRIV
ncbi:hypothetical protein [Streptomyces sp. NPDC048473]|uniref:hypothetical protein n=1 Tax=Streptomyces sp. NPDC048473 TaxID=3365556 RepID=UPI003718BFBD